MWRNVKNKIGQELPPATEFEFRTRALRHGNKLIFVGGAVSFEQEDGDVENAILIEDAQALAQRCTLQILANLEMGCGGNLNRVIRCIKLTALINTAADFRDHPRVADAASALLVQVFGEAGKHTRSAIGVNELPLGTAIQMHAVFEIRK